MQYFLRLTEVTFWDLLLLATKQFFASYFYFLQSTQVGYFCQHW